MEANYWRTLHALRADRSNAAALSIAILALGIAAWLAWFALAPLESFASSRAARLEARGAAQAVSALHAGRIAAVHAALGQRVHRGDVLFELDERDSRLALEAARARIPALEARLASAANEREHEAERAQSEAQAAERELDETRALSARAESNAATARDEAQRFERLMDQGLVTEFDSLRLANRARGDEAEAQALRSRAERQASEWAARRAQSHAALERLDGERARLQGELDQARADVARLAEALDQCRLLAGCDGRVGELSPKRAGSTVDELETLAVVVPEGELGVVADLPVASATGRVRPGQSARVRLDALPWAAYGSLRARVSAVASEVVDGCVRVELDLCDDPAVLARWRDRLAHGMSGRVDVHVETLTPAALALRFLGRNLDGAARHDAGGDAP